MFTSDEVRLLEVLGAQVGPALEAASLHGSLAASEARFRTLFESMAGGVLILDRNGLTVDCNRAAAEIMECERADLIGSVPADGGGWRRLRADGTDLPDTARPASVVLATGRPVRSGLMRLQKDGFDKWIQFDGVPLLDSEGEIERVIVSFLDVSAAREAEIAKRENEAKDRFLAAMSHELRTPLNSILGFGQLLQEPGVGPLGERQQRYVQNIVSSGRHLLDLVNDVLDLSKVAAGHMDIQPEDFELRRLLEEALTRIRPLADAKAIDLRLEGRSSPSVRADRRRLEQVVWNLISNAIKFTPERGSVAIRAGRSGSEVWIEVSDTGIGIAPGNHDRVFHEFTQVEAGRDRPHEGTGLGLALTRELVLAMGGTVSLKSTVGEGSTFTVTLPAADQSG